MTVAKRLLDPTLNEQAAKCLGNLIIQVMHKIEPKIDTDLLMCVVQKLYKTRMPSSVQSLILVFARLIHKHPNEIIEFLSETSIDNRISLKTVTLMISKISRPEVVLRTGLSGEEALRLLSEAPVDLVFME